ncbi:MAG: cupredoxin domain-containing protein [Actinomycetota bacterium]|nr:cupredoxin domain-containing protein [Actinomycetota bacterium]
MPRRRAPLAVAAAVLLAVALGGCSSGGVASSPQDTRPVVATLGPDGVQQVSIDGNDKLRFVPSVIQARTGRLAITLHNAGQTNHILGIDVLGADTGNVGGGSSKTVSFTVTTPGSYEFVCSYHRDAGMLGRLVVS